MPDEAAQARAAALIRDLFKVAYARRKPADRLALAAQLLQRAEETDDDPAGRFVLLGEARDLAAGAGDVVTALAAVEKMANWYAVDVLPLKMTALATAVKGARTAVECRAVADKALALIDETLAADRFGAAQQLVTHAETAAGKGGHLLLLKQVRARAQEVNDYRQQAASARLAADTLQEQPEDAGANLALGKYLCFWKGKWAEGLPRLAQGSDQVLQALAERDLAEPQDPTARAKLGDAWFQLASRQEGPARAPLLRRALHWYREALPGLNGFNQTRVEKRIRELDGLVPRLPR
jgi:hypothetical protein